MVPYDLSNAIYIPIVCIDEKKNGGIKLRVQCRRPPARHICAPESESNPKVLDS